MQVQNCTIFFKCNAGMFAQILTKTQTMQFKTFSFAAFLILFYSGLSAKGTLFTSSVASPETANDWRCNVPAPANFGADETSGTGAHLTWSYVPEAVGGYQIQIIRDSDHHLMSTQNKSQNDLEIWISDLAENEHYTAEIRGICGDHQVSELKNTGPIHTVILELIVNGYTPPEMNGNFCNISSNYGSCPFPTSDGLYHFKVTKGSDVRYFGVQTTYSSSSHSVTYSVDIGYQNDPAKSPISFFCLSQTTESTAECHFDHIVVKYNGTTIAWIEVFNSSGLSSSKLQCSFINDCTVSRVVVSGKPGEAGDDQDAAYIEPVIFKNLDFVKASPNPFQDKLEVALTSKTTAGVYLTLFTPEGKAIIRERFDADQNRYALTTESLHPGLYFLRVQSGDQIQTLKVLKSE